MNPSGPDRAELRRTYDTRPLGPGTALHVHASPKWKTVFFDFFIRRDLGPGTTGFAMLPGLLKRGTRRHPDLRALTRRLEELFGASLRSDILKIGELQVLLVRLEVANPKHVPRAPRILEEGVEFLRDFLFDPLVDDGAFPRDVVEQEKRNQIRYIEGLGNDKAAYATERCCEEMCGPEPFGLYEYGKTEEVRSLDARLLADTHREAVSRLPLDLYVSGDVDADAIERLVRPVLAGRAGDLGTRAPTPHPARRAPREVIEERPVRQGKLVLGYRTEIRASDPRYHALLVMNGVLGAFPHSKLFRVVREREGLCYYASSSLEKTKGVLLVSSGIEPRNYATARRLIEAQLEALASGDVAPDELAETRLALARNLETIGDSASRTATQAYTGLLNGVRATVADEIEAIEAVTARDVVEAARTVWLDMVYFLRDPEVGPAHARAGSEVREAP